MLKIFLDAACTQEMLFSQALAGDGAQTAFALDTANHPTFTGDKIGSVYLETAVSHAGITFAGGIGSGFSALTVNALKGQRVIHNGTFRGTVVSNTATSVTISDATYTQATASAALISSYVKQTAGTAYNVVGNSAVFIAAPTSSQVVHILPTNVLSMNFGGAEGTVKTTQASFWLRRYPLSTTPGASLNQYDGLVVQAVDNSQVQTTITQLAITFTAGVGTGFAGLVAGALIGRAVMHGGVYCGTVTANTTTTVTISDGTYNGASAQADVITIGSLQFANDSAGAPGAFAPILQPAAISNDTPLRIWVRDTITVPNAAMNYPNQRPSVKFTEYLA